MPEVKLTPLSMPRPRGRLVFAPPVESLGLRDGDGDATLVCGEPACAFVFGRRVNPERLGGLAFRCPRCGTESELPPGVLESDADSLARSA